MPNPFAPTVTDFTITGRVKLSDGNSATFTITGDGAAYVDNAYNVDASAARELQEVILTALKAHLTTHPLPLPGSGHPAQSAAHPVDARTTAGNQTPPPSPAYPKHLGY